MPVDFQQKYNWADISNYRSREIKLAVDFISDLLSSKASQEFTNGALSLFSKIILIPLDMAGTPEERALVNSIISKEFEEVKVDLVRRIIFRD